jgi:hypothetical protein
VDKKTGHKPAAKTEQGGIANPEIEFGHIDEKS